MNIYPLLGFSDPVSTMTHLFSSPVFLVGGIVMLWRMRGNTSRTVSLLVFVLSAVILLAISGVFHLLAAGSSARYVLQILDHAAIFLLIAGTFTPTHVLLFKGFLRWGILLLVWTTAITGITLKSIYFEEVPETLSLALYLGLGWLGALTGYLLYRRLGFNAISPLLYGAIAYTLGATLEFMRFPVLVPGIIGPHEIFHVFVLFGISYHWQFIHRMANLHKEKVQKDNGQVR